MIKPVPGPDRLEQGIRLGCGGLFGLFVGVYIVFRIVLRLSPPSASTLIAWATVGVSTVVCALLSRHYGDRFWGGAFGDRAYTKPWNRREPPK